MLIISIINGFLKAKKIHQTFFLYKVTLLQTARNPGNAENFTFSVDESVGNLTVYITGVFFTVSLVSPSGDASMLTIQGKSFVHMLVFKTFCPCL